MACEGKKIKLSTINEHISCHICEGYLIEATTIIECLHTFCRTCIVKHLKEHNTCPKCKQVIHQSHPLNYISFDRTMQDIVYKLVPGLERPKDQANANNNDSNNNNVCNGNESNSETVASKAKSTTTTDANKLKPIDTNGQQRQTNNNEHSDYHRNDEQVNLHVIPDSSHNLKPLRKPFIRTSNLATTNHLKKYVSIKLYGDQERYKEFDLCCNGNLLGNDHSFKFISVTQWRDKVPPIKITYRPRVED